MAAKKDHKIEPRIKDPVSVMKIFKESVNKQKLNQKIYEDFQINTPQHLNMYTEKPNTNKMLLMKMKDQGRTINGVDYDQILNNQDDEVKLPQHITNRLTSMNEMPKNKYNMPQTSNQEFGWHVVNNTNTSKFTYPRKGCKETGYADDYFTMNHYSPFSKKNK